MAKEWTLKQGEELRIEVDVKDAVMVKLVEGTAEIFGAEMVLMREYTLSACKLAVFTYDGCLLELSDTISKGEAVVYVSDEGVITPKVFEFFNAHRQSTVIVLGHGRNTITRTLANYSIRSGLNPVVISIDPRRNAAYFPTCLSAVVWRGVVEGDEVTMVPTSYQSDYAVSMVASLFFGSTVIMDNRKLYVQLVSQLAQWVKKLPKDFHPVLITGPGTEQLDENEGLASEIVNAFSIDDVLIIGDERLSVRLSKHADIRDRIVKMPKSGGLVGWPRSGDNCAQDALVKAYFYGTMKRPLTPFTQTCKFDSVKIKNIKLDAGAGVAPMSALPVGAVRKLADQHYQSVSTITRSLLYDVMAVLHPNSNNNDQEDSINVAGYVHVTDVDEERQTITVLSPCPGELPSLNFLTGKLKWIE